MISRVLKSYKIRYLIAVGLLLVVGFLLEAQPLPHGTPPMRNFTKKMYQAAPQNWSICQSANQIMYFANNLGLLRFDGSRWTVHPNDNKTIIRSLFLSQDEKIYAGGQGELGYYQYNSNGQLQYFSLKNRIEDTSLTFEDVWHIITYKDRIYFQTSNEIFEFHPQTNQMKVHNLGVGISLITASHRGILAFTEKGSIYRNTNGKFLKTSLALSKESTVTGQINWNKDSILVATYQDGMYWLANDQITPLEGRWNDYFKNQKINKITHLSDGNVVVGLAKAGILLFNPKRSQGQKIDKVNGLQGNNIIGLFQDCGKDLWVCSENGIDLIQYQSSYRYLYPDGYLRGAGYTAGYHERRLYLGTSNGLYLHEPTNGIDQFILLEGSEGQVWKVDTVLGKIILGHHQGAFLVKDKKLTALYKSTGSWKFIPYNSKFILGGTYRGLILADWSNGIQSFSPLENFKESSRILVKDKYNNYWMSHPYRGVYLLNINEKSRTVEPKLYNISKGIPSDLNNYIFLINQTVYVAAEDGLYRYKPEYDQFEKDTLLGDLIGAQNRIQLLFQDSDLDIWFYTANELGLLRRIEEGISSKYERVILDPLPEKLLGGFEFIYELPEKKFLMGCEEGFLMMQKQRNQSIRTFMTQLSAININYPDRELLLSTINNALGNSKNEPYRLSYKSNKISFQYTTTSYGDERREYRYLLAGVDDHYSEWSHQTEVSYSNLKPGDYIFQVQAKVGGIIQTDESLFYFTISAPWYKTRIAVLGIVLLGIIIIIGLFLTQRKGFESQKRELTSQLKEEVKEIEEIAEQREKALIRLKNEKLQSEIEHKNNELASATMHLVQKQELLTNVQKGLSRVLKLSEMDKRTKQELQSIISDLQQDTNFDEDWNRFTTYFDEVHSSFLSKLKQDYPHLTVHDHKLCAYLRMDLSTKDIAHLLNISVRGVEGSRYRLRKKLGLDGTTNLSEFIRQL
jgi:ligand-binding sensor domain-containing protein/DNA-binding CsgD family transcriptional regulator